MPNVIWLNGASSSGKTTLAKALQLKLSDVYLHAQIDQFIAMLPEEIQYNRHDLEKHIEHIVYPFHRSVKDLATTGNKLIVDHVFENEKWLIDCLKLMIDTPVLFVGLHCSLEELVRRERVRGDRALGLAEWHFESIHKRMTYDIDLNSSLQTVDECAREIERYLQDSQIPSAFESLRRSYNIA